MPFMLQPKNYIQIARPNLYNGSYRRVGAYMGMGRLHPTNYLELGPRRNMLGATSGQYNTFSGQAMLLPPSLRGMRGLGQSLAQTNFAQYAPPFMSQGATGMQINSDGSISATSFVPPAGALANPGLNINPDGSISATSFTQDMPIAASPSSQPIAPASGAGGGSGTPPAAGNPQLQQALPWILGGAAGLLLMMGMMRR